MAGYRSKNAKNGKKTVVRNKAVREFCKELNIELEKDGNYKEIAKAAVKKAKSGEGNQIRYVLEFAGIIEIDEKDEGHERTASILEAWANDTEWPGEVKEETAETVQGSREPEDGTENAETSTDSAEAAGPGDAKPGDVKLRDATMKDQGQPCLNGQIPASTRLELGLASELGLAAQMPLAAVTSSPPRCGPADFHAV
jgi:hypothetical protein